jgi:hypothetical protein
MVALGPNVILQYTLQGLVHPARKVREAFWRVYNIHTLYLHLGRTRCGLSRGRRRRREYLCSNDAGNLYLNLLFKNYSSTYLLEYIFVYDAQNSLSTCCLLSNGQMLACLLCLSYSIPCFKSCANRLHSFSLVCGLVNNDITADPLETLVFPCLRVN